MAANSAGADFSSPQAQAWLEKIYNDPAKMQTTDGCAPGTGYAETYWLTTRQTCADCFDSTQAVMSPPCVPQKVFVEHPVYAQNGTRATQRIAASGEWYIVHDPQRAISANVYDVYPVLTSGWGMAFIQLALPIITAGWAAIGELAMASAEIATTTTAVDTTVNTAGTISEGTTTMGEGFGFDIGSAGDYTDFFGDFDLGAGLDVGSWGDMFPDAGSFGDFGSGVVDPSIITDATSGWNIPDLNAGAGTGSWIPDITSGLPGYDAGGVFNESANIGTGGAGGISAGTWTMPQLDQVLSTAMRAYQVWNQAQKPPVRSGTTTTSTTGTRTTPNKNGTITTTTTAGRTTVAKMPVGTPYAFPDGTVVVNNGDGTYSVIGISGQAQVVAYPAGTGTVTGPGAPLVSGIDNRTLLIAGVGLGALLLMR